MHLIPTEIEILDLLRQTGALREGHFEYPNGLHSARHIAPALALRFYQDTKILTVALSRQLRANVDLRVKMPELSIVSATPAGLPLAQCLGEVLQPRQVYWGIKDTASDPLRFPQFLKPAAGEKVILVDDILRTGILIAEAKSLLESYGAEVIALAVLFDQRTARTVDFGPLPLYSLVAVHYETYGGPSDCPLCRAKEPLTRVHQDWKPDETGQAVLAVDRN